MVYYEASWRNPLEDTSHITIIIPINISLCWWGKGPVPQSTHTNNVKKPNIVQKVIHNVTFFPAICVFISRHCFPADLIPRQQLWVAGYVVEDLPPRRISMSVTDWPLLMRALCNHWVVNNPHFTSHTSRQQIYWSLHYHAINWRLTLLIFQKTIQYGYGYSRATCILDRCGPMRCWIAGVMIHRILCSILIWL